jgi:hypothetical protein
MGRSPDQVRAFFLEIPQTMTGTAFDVVQVSRGINGVRNSGRRWHRRIPS